MLVGILLQVFRSLHSTRVLEYRLVLVPWYSNMSLSLSLFVSGLSDTP